MKKNTQPNKVFHDLESDQTSKIEHVGNVKITEKSLVIGGENDDDRQDLSTLEKGGFSSQKLDDYLLTKTESDQ